MHCFGMLMDDRAQPTGIRRRGEDATLLLVLNEFTLPETAGGGEWSLLIDTNLVEDVEPKSFRDRRPIRRDRPIGSLVRPSLGGVDLRRWVLPQCLT